MPSIRRIREYRQHDSENCGATDDRRAEMSRHLLSIYRELDLEVLNLNFYFTELASASEVLAKFYVHFEDGSVRHLSPLGNLRVAQRFAEVLASEY